MFLLKGRNQDLGLYGNSPLVGQFSLREVRLALAAFVLMPGISSPSPGPATPN